MRNTTRSANFLLNSKLQYDQTITNGIRTLATRTKTIPLLLMPRRHILVPPTRVATAYKDLPTDSTGHRFSTWRSHRRAYTLFIQSILPCLDICHFPLTADFNPTVAFGANAFVAACGIWCNPPSLFLNNDRTEEKKAHRRSTENTDERNVSVCGVKHMDGTTRL